VRPAPLLGCSEKSPRQEARAVRHDVDHQTNLMMIGANAALIERRRQSGTVVLTSDPLF
jgi:hypothetical protein